MTFITEKRKKTPHLSFPPQPSSLWPAPMPRALSSSAQVAPLRTLVPGPTLQAGAASWPLSACLLTLGVKIKLAPAQKSSGSLP